MGKFVGLIGVTLAVAATGAHAQTVVDADADHQIEEVVVTAQKRSENLQNVPAAVTAFSAQAVASFRLFDVRSIADRTPNFSVGQQGPASPTLTIRGIGSSDREAGSDRSVVVFIDEVYIGRAGASTFDLFDIAQVEVLRGPQGSLFGRNAVGGALSLTTSDPERTFGGYADLTAGNFKRFEARGVVTGPITESLSGRLAVSGSSKDGYYYSRRFDRRVGDSEGVSWRGKLLYEPSEDLRITLAVDGSRDNIDGLGHATARGGVSQAAFEAGITRDYSAGGIPLSDPYKIGSNIFGGLDRSLDGIMMRAEWSPGYGTFTFIPSYRRGHYEVTDDVSAVLMTGAGPTSRGFLSAEITDERYQATSGELRFTSPKGERFDWLVGLYGLAEITDRQQVRDRLLNNAYSRPIFFQKSITNSLAAFGSATWHVLPNLDLSAGARYTKDSKDFRLITADTLTPVDRARLTAFYGRAPTLSPLLETFDVAADGSWSEFTPDASVSYRFAEGMTLYGRVASGYKSGGFNGLGATAAQARLAFDPEKAINYEGGLKARLLNNTVQINSTAFRVDFKDLQLRDRIETIPGDPTSAIVTIINAAKARITGFESEIIAKPVAGLTLNGSASVLRAKIVETKPGSTLISGSDLPRSPKWSVTGSAAYDWYLADDAQLQARVEYRHVASHYLDINSQLAAYEKPYSLLNARLTYTAPSKQWSVAAWANNLTDEVYRTDAQVGSGGFYTVAQISEPRTYGVTLHVEY